MLILSIETLCKIIVYVMDWRDFINLYALKKPWKLEKNKIKLDIVGYKRWYKNNICNKGCYCECCIRPDDRTVMHITKL